MKRLKCVTLWIGYYCKFNQLNLTAVKFIFLKTQTYLAQENLAFGKILFKKNNLNCLLKILFSLPFLKK